MPTIVKRAEGVYLVRIFLGRNASGKQQFKNKTIHGQKRDVERWAREEERRRDLGELATATERRTLTEQVEAWLKLKEPDVSRVTIEGYRQVLPYLGELGPRQIHRLKADDVTDLYASLRSAGYSSRTVRMAHIVICGSLKLAYRHGLLRKDITESIKSPKVKRQITIRALTPAQARRFLQACESVKSGVVLHLALETGLRPEEYLGLRWSDVDLERCELRVAQVCTRFFNGEWALSEDLKTAKARRIVPFSERLRDKLRVCYASRTASTSRYNLVFHKPDGDPLSAHWLRYGDFRKVLKLAELDEATRLYDLRHSCASLLLDAGVNPKVISERLGHASVAFTLDTYCWLFPASQDQATKFFISLVQP